MCSLKKSLTRKRSAQVVKVISGVLIKEEELSATECLHAKAAAGGVCKRRGDSCMCKDTVGDRHIARRLVA